MKNRTIARLHSLLDFGIVPIGDQIEEIINEVGEDNIIDMVGEMLEDNITQNKETLFAEIDLDNMCEGDYWEYHYGDTLIEIGISRIFSEMPWPVIYLYIKRAINEEANYFDGDDPKVGTIMVYLMPSEEEDESDVKELRASKDKAFEENISIAISELIGNPPFGCITKDNKEYLTSFQSTEKLDDNTVKFRLILEEFQHYDKDNTILNRATGIEIICPSELSNNNEIDGHAKIESVEKIDTGYRFKLTKSE